MKTSELLRLRGVTLAALLFVTMASEAQTVKVKYTVRDLGAGADIHQLNGDMLKTTQDGVTYRPAFGEPVSMSLLPNASYSAQGPDADGNVFVYAMQLLSQGRPPVPRGPTLDPQKAALWNVKSGQITEIDWPYANSPGTMTRDGTIANSVGGLSQFSVPPFVWNIKTGFIYLDKNTPGATSSDRFSDIVSAANGPDSAGRWMVGGTYTNAAGVISSATYLWQPGISVKKVMGSYSTKYPYTYATSFNDKGQVAGYATNDTMQSRPFVWVPKIGFLPLSLAATSDLRPRCLSNAGQVIGVDYTSSGPSKGFIWSLLTGVKYLTNLLDAQSKQYTITGAYSCPDEQGRILALASTPDGMTHSVVLEPTTTP